MNNLIAQRFTEDKKQGFTPPFEVKNSEVAPATPSLAPIVPVEVLRTKILERLNPQPKIVTTPTPLTNLPAIQLVHFANIYEFVHWYENNKSFFNERQQPPLDTLIEARNVTLGTCNCDREKRRQLAEDAFRKFWIMNQKTDLLPTLQAALKTKKIIFGDFLAYPS